MTPKEAIAAAASNVGSKAALARHLGLTRAAISQWQSVPPHHVLTVERLSGISRHELRPDLYPMETA